MCHVLLLFPPVRVPTLLTPHLCSISKSTIVYLSLVFLFLFVGSSVVVLFLCLPVPFSR